MFFCLEIVRQIIYIHSSLTEEERFPKDSITLDSTSKSRIIESGWIRLLDKRFAIQFCVFRARDDADECFSEQWFNFNGISSVTSTQQRIAYSCNLGAAKCTGKCDRVLAAGNLSREITGCWNPQHATQRGEDTVFYRGNLDLQCGM